MAIDLRSLQTAALDGDDLSLVALTLTADPLSKYMPTTTIEHLARIGIRCEIREGDAELVRKVATAFEIVRSRNA